MKVGNMGSVTAELTPDVRMDFRRARVRTTLPERVVFLIDLHEEMTEQWNDNFASRMAAIKDAISKFVRRKKNSPLRHMFALASYKSEEEVNLVINFSFNEDKIISGLDEITPEICNSVLDKRYRTEEGIDLAVILESLCDRLKLPAEMSTTLSVDSSGSSTRSFSSPNYLTRCILVYGRSREVPIDSSSKYQNAVPNTRATGEFTAASPYIPLMHHPHCYLDIIYLHLRANEENARCQEIFDRLSRLVHNAHPFGEREQYSNLEPFVLETHASAIKLGSHMAALLAHPAQREESSVLSSRMDMSAQVVEKIRKLIADDAPKKS